MSQNAIALLVLLAVIGAVAAVWLRRKTQQRALDRAAEIDALVATGDYQAAERAVASALADQTTPDMRRALRRSFARALAGQEKYAAALRVCATAADEAPNEPERAEAIVEGARCLAATGAFDEAGAELERARTLSASTSTLITSALLTADMALARLRFAEAENALAAAFELAGRGPAAAEVTLQHAQLQYVRGHFQQAVAEVSRVLEQLPSDDLQARALVLLARALLEQAHADTVGADHAITRAGLIVHQQGLAAVIRALRGLIQAHFGNTKEALEAAQGAPTLTASNRWAAEVHYVVGDTLRQLGQFSEARTSYQTALTLDSARIEPLWGLGCCAQALGFFEIAETYFTLCTQAAPEHFLGQRSEAATEQS